QRLGQVRSTAHPARELREEILRSLTGRLAGDRLFAEAIADLLALLFEGGDENLLFAREALIDRAKCDIRRRSNISETDGGKTFALREGDRRIHDPLGSLI